MNGFLKPGLMIQICLNASSRGSGTNALSILTLPENKGKTMYLTASNNLKFIKKVTPETDQILKQNKTLNVVLLYVVVLVK